MLGEIEERRDDLTPDELFAVLKKQWAESYDQRWTEATMIILRNIIIIKAS